MKDLRDYHVAACNREGLVIYSRTWTAQSAIAAANQAEADLWKDNATWWTIWVGDPAQPEFMKTTKEGR